VILPEKLIQQQKFQDAAVLRDTERNRRRLRKNGVAELLKSFKYPSPYIGENEGRR